jgi:hypothetical protein
MSATPKEFSIMHSPTAVFLDSLYWVGTARRMSRNTYVPRVKDIYWPQITQITQIFLYWAVPQTRHISQQPPSIK